MAFEEPHSTSGFLLPAGTLVQRGFTIREVAGAQSTVAPDEIGYFFSRDEENTMEMVSQRRIAAGGISVLDYDQLPGELKEQLMTLDRTITVPRQIVSVRSALHPDMVSRMRDLLLGLEQTEEGRQILTGMQRSKFDPLLPDSQASLQQLKELIRSVPQE